MICGNQDSAEFFDWGEGVNGLRRRGVLFEGVFVSSGCSCATTLVGGGVEPGVGGCRSGGMTWGSSADVGTSFGPGKRWDGDIVAYFGYVGTLGTCSTAETVVTLGTVTRGCWRKRTALGWSTEGGRGTGGCGW